MTTPHTNPFVLPGMGQDGDTAHNPLFASMEMMRKAWTGLTGPNGLAQSLPMTPPMNLDDLERRVNELRSIESWLRMNLSMLSSTIQGLEVQRSTIATLRSFVGSVMSTEGYAAADGVASPLEIVLGLKPGPRKAPAPQAAAGASGFATPPGAEGAADAQASGAAASAPFGGLPFGANLFGAAAGADAPFGANPFANPAFGNPAFGAAFAPPKSGEPQAPAAAAPAAAAGEQGAQAAQVAQSASQAWWDMLQQQFNQIAQATAASMPAAPVAPAHAPAAGGRAGSSGFDPDMPSTVRAAPAPQAAPPRSAPSPSAPPAKRVAPKAKSAATPTARAAAGKTAGKTPAKTAAKTTAGPAAPKPRAGVAPAAGRARKTPTKS